MFSQFVFALKMKIKQTFPPAGPHAISVLIALTLGHLCSHLTDVPPQPDSPRDNVFHAVKAPGMAPLLAKNATSKIQ